MNIHEVFAHPMIKPVSLVVVPPSIVIAPVVRLESVVWILVWLFLIDLFSGLLASYFKWKKTAAEGRYFFGQSGGFSSDKFKKCFVKGIVYGGFPLIILKFQQVFMLKTISVKYLTDSQIDVTTICLLVFCANEFFSIFWENLPECGLNLPKGIRNLIVGVKDIANEVKE
ncbi:phage holin family protein [Flavobacterium aestivum]|uniref:phage holin family protein n=1 Tax=Flavobacterium aestivum TaxID=3003257 RepID=UPI002482B420|nr:phage holin family protein [Flavobacterium aestivum]